MYMHVQMRHACIHTYNGNLQIVDNYNEFAVIRTLDYIHHT